MHNYQKNNSNSNLKKIPSQLRKRCRGVVCQLQLVTDGNGGVGLGVVKAGEHNGAQNDTGTRVSPSIMHWVLAGGDSFSR